jgi:hypothetical protein
METFNLCGPISGSQRQVNCLLENAAEFITVLAGLGRYVSMATVLFTDHWLLSTVLPARFQNPYRRLIMLQRLVFPSCLG